MTSSPGRACATCKRSTSSRPGQLNTYDVLVSDDVVFTEGALAEFLAGPPKGKGADAVARESELEDLADAVTTLAKEPLSRSRPAAKPTKAAKAAGREQGQDQAAGEGVSDEEMVAEVEAATSSESEDEPKFEAEAEGAQPADTEAAKDPDGVGE